MRATPYLLIATLFGASAASAEMANYKIDDDHTYATFAIDHFGASVNRARFNKAAGTVRFDKLAKAGQIDLTLDVKSVNSGSAAFDKHLQAPDMFNVAQHPTMRFVSEKMVFEGERLKEVSGKLTLLGQTQPVTLKANQFGCYPNSMAKTEACGGDFEAVIDRTKWGMNAFVEMGMPKNVKITATIEAFQE